MAIPKPPITPPVPPGFAGTFPNSNGFLALPLPSIATRFPVNETFTIAGVTMPGQWLLDKTPKKFGWLEQKGYFLDGAYVLPTGAPLVHATFRGKIWTEDQVATYKSVRKSILLNPLVGADQSAATAASGAGFTFAQAQGLLSLTAIIAYGVSHPELNAIGVTKVVIGEFSTLYQSPEGAGLWEADITLIQYRPPLKAPARPTQSIPATTPAQQFGPPTPQQAQNAELAAINANKAAQAGSTPAPGG